MNKLFFIVYLSKMARSFLMIAILSLILMESCSDGDGGDYATFRLCIAFVDDHGNDFFEGNQDYSIEDFTYAVSNGKEVFDFLQPLWIRTIGGNSVIVTMPRSAPAYYYDFGNGDIDTLTIEFDPSLTVERGYGYWYYGKIHHYFNGILVNTWNFNTREAKDEVFDRNVPSKVDDPDFDPVIVYLPKEPDPDELD